VDGKQTTSPIFGALASYAINEKLAIGVGSFVSAGARAEYEAAPTSAPLTITLNPKTDLYAIEHSAGVGYEVMPGLKLGASLRYTQVTATLVSASMLSATLIGESTFSEMKASQFGGFRFGASYDGGSWGVGANYRSAVNFSATGTGTIRTESAGAPGTITTRDLTNPTIASTLPAQLALGGHFNASDALRLAAEYVLTNYQKVAALDIGGNLPTALGGSALPDLNLGFKNQTNLRLGASYVLNNDWTLRGGYVYTSQVTPAELARPTLTPPGAAHSITAGFGTTLTPSMDLNVAGEYTTTKGTGTGNTAAQTKAGDYAASGYVFHSGVSYRF
jgi:long-chain fatty acid transport protein